MFAVISTLSNTSWVAISFQPFTLHERQALKYRSVTDIVRPIREIVRRREEATGHSVRPK
jgi:hypothetical protein